MTPVEVIEQVLNAKFLNPSLIYIPDVGATVDDLESLSKKLPRKISDSHACLLQRWNGINLGVIRVFSATSGNRRLRYLIDFQLEEIEGLSGAVVFGDDPAGFVYLEDSVGEIYTLDSDPACLKRVAADLSDFFARLVFGKDASDFAGAEWHRDLRRVGLG